MISIEITRDYKAELVELDWDEKCTFIDPDELDLLKNYREDIQEKVYQRILIKHKILKGKKGNNARFCVVT